METTQLSIAEGLRQAHARLSKDLEKLEDDIRAESAISIAALRSRLNATYKHISAHFQFEERGGYMQAVVRREPHLVPTVEALGEEHRLLNHSLTAIIKMAHDANNLDDELRGKIRTWIERVRRHEEAENDLVQDAFYQDVGPED